MQIACLVHDTNAPLLPYLQGRFGDQSVCGGDSLAAILDALPEIEALVVSPLLYTSAVHDALRVAPRLRLIQSLSSGLDHFLDVGVPPGVALASASGVHTAGVSEHAVTLLLSLCRQLPQFVQAQKREAWLQPVAGSLRTLEEMSVLIIGWGPIGKAIAGKLTALGAQVTGVNRLGTSEDGDTLIAMSELSDRIGKFEAVILALPGVPETDGIVGEALLTRMQPRTLLVNVGRGSLVDEDAIIAALQTCRLGGYATDVTAVEPLPQHHPFWSREDVLLTPHIAGRNPVLSATSCASWSRILKIS